MARTPVPARSHSPRSLPVRPHLDYLKKLAKERLRAMRVSSPDAQLAEAQLLVAREHGFASWRALRGHLTTAGRDAGRADDPAADGFLAAVHAGDVEGVRRQLEETPGLVNRVGRHPAWGGRPQALHLTIERGDRLMFDVLLGRGADPAGDNAGYDGWSPLMLAIHWKRDAMRDELLKRIGHTGLIESLMMGDDTTALRAMEAGAAPLLQPTPNDATMLHFTRTPASAARLLELGVPLDENDKHGKTPIIVAAERGDTELVRFLIGRGAEATPAILARVGDLPRLRAALGPSQPGDGVMHAAVGGGRHAVVRWLLGRGGDANARDAERSQATLLHTAAWNGDLAMVTLLIDCGADPRAKDGEYEATPLQWAEVSSERTGNPGCQPVKAFLEEAMATRAAGTKRAKRVKADWKPLMDAAFAGDASKVRKLLAAGADPDVLSPTNHRHRPLHRCIERKKTSPKHAGHEETVRALLDGGADPKLRATHGGHTALQLAAIDEPRFVPLLADLFKPLDFFHAVVLLDEKRVAALLAKDGGLATGRDENGWTPLHYVAASAMFRTRPRAAGAQLAIARRLIDAGGDVAATYPYDGEWPIPVLFYACGYHDNPRLAELLNRAGASPCDNESVYHASDEGHAACLDVIGRLTPADALAKECTSCLATQLHWKRTRGMAWLLAHGADPNGVHPRHGRSALQAAAYNGASEAVIGKLLAHGGDPRAKSADGRDALALARAAKRTRIVSQLFG